MLEEDMPEAERRRLRTAGSATAPPRMSCHDTGAPPGRVPSWIRPRAATSASRTDTSHTAAVA